MQAISRNILFTDIYRYLLHKTEIDQAMASTCRTHLRALVCISSVQPFKGHDLLVFSSTLLRRMF